MLAQAKIGIAPLTWSNDDKPEIGAENTFQQCISEMALAGYAGCEIGAKFPTDLAVLRYELALRGLVIANQWFTFEASIKDVAAIRPCFLQHIHLLRELGATVVGGGEFAQGIVSREDVPICGAARPYRPILNPADWKTFTQRINALGKIAYEEGLTLCFHHHMGTCVETLAETEQLLHDCNSKYVALNYDSGHFAFAGTDPADALAKLNTRVKHVHLKNIRPDVLKTVKTEQLSFLQAVVAGVFTIPGDNKVAQTVGAVDFKRIFDLLAEVHYNGWLIVEAEQDPSKAHPLATALAARQYLKAVLHH